jgi:hypothetical protein
MDSGNNPHQTNAGTGETAALMKGGLSDGTAVAGGIGEFESRSIVSGPPAASIGSTASAAAGSPEYPNNYVAKALLEQIVETQVHVLDNKDSLPMPQFSNHGTRPGIHVNSSYISLA